MQALHPIIQTWFQERVGAPTPPQSEGWPAILRGEHTLIAAPTGSGKTMAAFLVSLDRLLRQALAGELRDETQVLYISPLKALSEDIRLNLLGPLAELCQRAGEHVAKINVAVRTGDTTASARQAMIRRPPHILVTTPESLYLLLTSEGGRKTLRTVKSVIVDEIHALARDKRGSHLALSLARLDALVDSPPQRIGLSATQKPIERIADFLLGATGAHQRCHIVDTGHVRKLDLGLLTPHSPLSAVTSNEHWEEVYQSLAAEIEKNRSTLVFVNTRKMAERMAHNLRRLLGDEHVAAHHGSLAKEVRQKAERRLKAGELKAIVATASLELGIDVGFIDMVVQIGSPRSIATFLQRVGRSGHQVIATPKGRIVATTRDELLESMAVLHAIHHGFLDAIHPAEAPLDILAQQIVAETAMREWEVEDLWRLFRNSYPYRNLELKRFEEIVAMLADGFGTGSRVRSLVHYDRINGRVTARRSARLKALSGGGAIPETGDFDVVIESEKIKVGSVNEDFAIESNAGDIFLLGNTSWQVVNVRGGRVLVRDAGGAAPTIPFWLGEAPGRTVELSQAVSTVREQIAARVDIEAVQHHLVGSADNLEPFREAPPSCYAQALEWAKTYCGTEGFTATQAVHYITAQKMALGMVPTQEEIVFERFFDNSGGAQLVIHAPYGMRINRGFGLALRKRFCRSFDFELQASADDDGIVLSIGPHQSFAIESLFKFLSADNVTALLEQAVLQTPLFPLRWRWNMNRSLAVPRAEAGKRTPPAIQRFRADDLMTAVFPAQTQCQEHITGDIAIPNHPLVQQTMYDCLHEAIDIEGLKQLLGAIAGGQVKLLARETREPSPFAHQLLNANPYTFLDDAPLEERRARALSVRRELALDAIKDLDAIDPEVVGDVLAAAQPLVRDVEELHDLLLTCGCVPSQAVIEDAWTAWFDELVVHRRACLMLRAEQKFWVASENIPMLRAAFPDAHFDPMISLPPSLAEEVWQQTDAVVRLLELYVENHALFTCAELASELAMDPDRLMPYLRVVESKGILISGTYLRREVEEFCARRLLMRIQRETLERLREKIKPVSPKVFQKFLLWHHHLTPDNRYRGVGGTLEAIRQLQGFQPPAFAWERELLVARVEDYQAQHLDQLCYQGHVAWRRFQGREPIRQRAFHRTTQVSIFTREAEPWIRPEQEQGGLVSGEGQQLLSVLQERGALFWDELVRHSKLLPTRAEAAIGTLIASGRVRADGFGALRPLIETKKQTRNRYQGRGIAGLRPHSPTALGGRWAATPEHEVAEDPAARLEAWAWQLLRRYGVIFYEILSREMLAPRWSQLITTLRRLEARGEIRGGRFITDIRGEQFALPEAVDTLRRIRDENLYNNMFVISSADPLNLLGVMDEKQKVAPSSYTNLAIVDGEFVAVKTKTGIEKLRDVSPEIEATLRFGLSVTGRVRALANSAD